MLYRLVLYGESDTLDIRRRKRIGLSLARPSGLPSSQGCVRAKVLSCKISDSGGLVYVKDAGDF